MGQVLRRFFSARATWRLAPGGAWASSLASSTSSSGSGLADSGGRRSASGEDDGNTRDRRYPRGRKQRVEGGTKKHHEVDVAGLVASARPVMLQRDAGDPHLATVRTRRFARRRRTSRAR